MARCSKKRSDSRSINRQSPSAESQLRGRGNREGREREREGINKTQMKESERVRGPRAKRAVTEELRSAVWGRIWASGM